MSEVVRQFVMAALLQWRGHLEAVVEEGLDPVRDAQLITDVYDDFRAVNRALNQLRYGWGFQERVWEVPW